MSVVTWIMKKPPLSALVDQPGGMSVRTGLKAASELLEPLREEGRQRVEAAIAALEQNLENSSNVGEAEALASVYRLSSAVLDAAGPFGLDDLCKAAFSLCELADRYSRGDMPADRRSLEVHVHALRLLSHPGATPPEARQVVLDGLAKVLERVPA